MLWGERKHVVCSVAPNNCYKHLEMLRFPSDWKNATDTFLVNFITTKPRKTEAYWLVFNTINRKRVDTAQIKGFKRLSKLQCFYNIYVGITGENFSHSGEIRICCQNWSCNNLLLRKEDNFFFVPEFTLLIFRPENPAVARF